jgi:CheY-like chemotaxis protein
VADLAAKLELIFTHHAIARGKVLSIRRLPSRTQIVSDEVLLMRVLVNMLKNAFEATEPNGRVELWFEWRGQAPTFVVRNAGIMSEYVQARLFERSFTTRSREGRGIGTYSMKLYGERYLGGTVSFSSDEKNGTHFFISLPLHESPDHVQGGNAPLRAPGAESALRVLLADDDEALLRLGELILTRVGYSTTACRSGIEALEIFRDAPQSFDAVITDYTMPTMSGIALARHLAQIRRDIPVLLCTGIGETAITNLDDVGIDGCIAKPFTFQEFAESLKQVISGVASRKSTR